MPRSWHSSTEYFICRSTGLPQMSQISTRFLLMTPHFWQPTVSSCGWSVMIFEPQFAQVMRRCSRPLSGAALALPVPDREFDEVERAGLAEVAEGEDAGEDRLQSRVFALLGEEVHLQEPVIRLALHVDEVRQRHVTPDFGEVMANRFLFRQGGSVHSVTPVLRCYYRRGHSQATRMTDAQEVEPCGKGRSPPLRFRGVNAWSVHRVQQKAISGRDIPPRPDESLHDRVSRQNAGYLIVTLAPASSNFFLIVSASSFETASLIVDGAASTRSFASFRPRLVTSRTALMTLIFLSPTSRQKDGELGLHFDRSRGRGRTSCRCRGGSRGGRHAEAVFQCLDQVGKVQHRHRLNLLHEIFSRNSHFSLQIVLIRSISCAAPSRQSANSY